MTQYQYTKHTYNDKQTGFSLIELIIVLVIITVLALLLLPSLQDKTRQARRAVAQADLVELTVFAERYFMENRTYVGLTLPFTRSPRSTDNTEYYTISFSSGPSAINFTLQAVPTIAGGRGISGCDGATLTIDADATKSAVNSGTVLTNCW